MGVNQADKYPFLVGEEEFLKSAIKKEIPILGICLGAQILAKVYGAQITKAKREEIGWFRVELTQEGRRDHLFKGLNQTLEVFQWHEDTFNLPKEARLLAQGLDCKNQAARFSKYSWGLQFHIEINDGMIKDWIDYYSADLNKDKLIDGYYKIKNIYHRQAEIIYSNFAGIIAKRRDALRVR
jgi:GMP synthase (glutamine-hydrolysing)